MLKARNNLKITYQIVKAIVLAIFGKTEKKAPPQPSRWDFDPDNPDRSPPPPFVVLQLDWSVRRIIFETFAMELTQHHLEQFGTFRIYSIETKFGYNEIGAIKPFIFYHGELNVPEIYDFTWAAATALDLAKVSYEYAFAESMKLVAMHQVRHGNKPEKNKREENSRTLAGSYISPSHIYLDPPRHMLIVDTVLRDFANDIEDIGTVKRIGSSNHENMLRYFIRVNQDIELEGAYDVISSNLIDIAHEILEMDDLWGIVDKEDEDPGTEMMNYE
jgi:hypothetical protein